MDIKTRLLLPFTTDINVLALNYALQMADQRHATLVPLALVPVAPHKGARLERLQQAQDFLTMIHHKAQQRGVPIESSELYTVDPARSIEAFASEMDCQAVIIFLSNTTDILLGRPEIRSLLEHSACNLHIVLLPEKRSRFAQKLPLHLPRFSRAASHTSRLGQSGVEQSAAIIHQLLEPDHLQTGS
jgi:hypothetical protein